MNPRWRILLALILALCVAAGLAAQDKKREAQLRTVTGQVLDRDENPRASGVVYLRNLKTQYVTTHIADEKGLFRFSGLDPNVDYEIHAEFEGTMSSKRKVSSFDSRKEITVNLKLDKTK